MGKLDTNVILKMLSKGKNKILGKNQDLRCSFDTTDGYKNIHYLKKLGELLHIEEPFFKTFDGVPSATCSIKGETFINFSSYNYLNLNGDERVSTASQTAIQQYGTSVSASRMVSGERSLHQQLEKALADLHCTPDALAFVSGHATNVTTIGYLFGPKDIIIHDEFIHNSAIEGIKLSGAAKYSFPHNNWQALDQCLEIRRKQFERALIIIEGHYSMDGDYPDLPEFIRVKNKHQAILMVDEAHSIGVIGKTGRGIGELFDVDREEVDIWMGTLSKTLAGCGGYIAANDVIIEQLKYFAPGFLYSTGLVPPVAAASYTALSIMLKEPERIKLLHERSQQFLAEAKERGLNTGLSKGLGIIPIICHSSKNAAELSNRLFQKKINIQPILFPAVPEKQARLRCFINCAHTQEQISYVINEIADLIKDL